MEKKRVIVGMSGGVDSSVTAALLTERGFDVTGVFMKNWADPRYPCPWEEDRRDAMRVAAHLGIPFETWDFTKEYREKVVEYMLGEYRAGRTPNPDVMCNREIKFGLFLKRALNEGRDAVATGHYARVTNEHGVYKLLAGVDAKKDQSYFLWTLGQAELSHAIFPIGDFKKSEVREMARERNIPTAEKADSQGICFIGEIDVNQFLHDHIPEHRGNVVTTSGKTVGEHDGVEFYTIGQRQGIGIGGGIPYYVAAKNEASNTLTVAEGPFDENLFTKELVAIDPRWTKGTAPTFPLQCRARIRYRQPLQECKIAEVNDGTLRIHFNEAQRAVTPGQSIVFYDGDELIGGAVIQ